MQSIIIGNPGQNVQNSKIKLPSMQNNVAFRSNENSSIASSQKSDEFVSKNPQKKSQQPLLVVGSLLALGIVSVFSYKHFKPKTASALPKEAPKSNLSVKNEIKTTLDKPPTAEKPKDETNISLENVTEEIPKDETNIVLEKVTSENVESNFQKACLYLKTEQTPEAIKQFEKILDAYPADYESHIGVGLAYKKNKNYEKALEHYNDAIKFGVDGQNHKAYYNRCGLYWEMGCPEKAIEDISIAGRLDPNDSDYNKTKRQIVETPAWGIHLKYIDKVKKDPNNFDLFAARGLAYAKAGYNRQALEDIDKSISLNPTPEIPVYFAS